MIAILHRLSGDFNGAKMRGAVVWVDKWAISSVIKYDDRRTSRSNQFVGRMNILGGCLISMHDKMKHAWCSHAETTS
jgi:hypothetical protein